jgi:hypothetical protein
VAIDAVPDRVYRLITDSPTLASCAEEARGIYRWSTTCTVTERTWDRRPGWFTKTAWVGTGVRDRDAANAEHIRLTLQRLKEKAEAS